jgi:ribonucleoside-diphosphate reductase alpha chain
MIGVADTLAMLGRRYDSPSGRVIAGQIAQALAQASLAANSSLARDRGALSGASVAAVELARLRAMPAMLVESAQRTGVRHRRVTAITSHRRLARLANDVADGLDPLDHSDSLRDGEITASGRIRRAGGYACLIANRDGASPAAVALIDSQHNSSIVAQIGLRGAVQPWIDEPIDYPFRVAHAPDAQVTERLQQLAAANRLGGFKLAVTA